MVESFVIDCVVDVEEIDWCPSFCQRLMSGYDLFRGKMVVVYNRADFSWKFEEGKCCFAGVASIDCLICVRHCDLVEEIYGILIVKVCC